MKFVTLSILVLLCAAPAFAQGEAGKAANPYAGYANWPMKDANFFPIAVWMQSARKADQYKAAGVNLYVAVSDRMDAKGFADFEKAVMHIICSQNPTALQYAKDHPNGVIAGWMHGDEPDNAQDIKNWKSIEDIKAAWPESTKATLKDWGQYGPPIPPKTIVADYEQIKKNDPTRPVMLNLGVGVADETYVGRGYRARKLDDYPEYVKGCDIVSFDIYPVVSKGAVKGNLWYVPQGVDRLVKWGEGKKAVWDCIECTHISAPPAIASGDQIKTEVWMSLIHGSRGLIYFCHEFKPAFIEAGMLAHPEQLKAVTEVNHQILALAPVLNSPTIEGGAEVKSSDEKCPVSVMVRKFDGSTYVFAVAMRDAETTASFKLKAGGDATAEVIDEGRTVPVKGGAFEDKFKGYGVHLYKIK
jgi:hypothetical protein